MASSEVVAELSRANSSTDKISEFNHLLQRIVQNSPPAQLAANLEAWLDTILGDTLGIMTSRPLLETFAQALKGVPRTDVKIQVGRYFLNLLRSQSASFEVQDASTREMLADAYEDQGEHIAAAKELQEITLESSQRTIPDEYKFKVWIRIIRNYLEEDEFADAELYLNRAKSLVHKSQDQALNLMFQLSQARILDARRKFLEASQSYHGLSFSPLVVEDERMRALSSAIVCAVLAPAGPQRSRTLARLYKDERAHELPEFGILEKIFLDRLLSPNEVENFAANLAEHQLAKTADGSTVLAKAVIEHNLLGASRVYEDIRFEELGGLLGLPGHKAEHYASRMIEQGRLSGSIDQIRGLISFGGDAGTGDRVGANAASGKTLRKWDSNVQGLAEEVEKVTSFLQSEYPDFVAANLAH
ncbi:MAG: hypothetical protein M1816_007509 [Peltula sp. TS41687]|nr:MAG: hypothetical protein M1816_007509 [Peltula sp. TS41687]